MIPGTLEILDGEAWIVFAKKTGERDAQSDERL